MEHMVDATAEYLAAVLKIADAAVDANPLVEITRREVRYYASLSNDGRVEQNKELCEVYNFVVTSERLASRMRECAEAVEHDGNVDVSRFSTEMTYYCDKQVIQDEPTENVIDVGGIGYRLFLHIQEQASKWLDDSDAVLCELNGVERGQDERWLEAKDELANAIAERMTLMSTLSVLEDGISSRSLESMVRAEYERCFPSKALGQVVFSRPITKAHGGVWLPRLPFLNAPPCAVAKLPPRTCTHDPPIDEFYRQHMDAAGERVVALVRVVWELASKGYFSAGVVAASLVSSTAYQSIKSARFAGAHITMTMRVGNTGWRLWEFMRRLYNMEGDHVDALDKAVCHLSHFSCLELEAAFHTQGGVLPFLCEGLTKRTISKMCIPWCDLNKLLHAYEIKADDSKTFATYVAKTGYTTFASESLSLLLPLIYQRRTRLGIPHFMRSNAFLDFLNTAPAAKGWHPTRGGLKLSVLDVKAGHPSLRGVLDSLHEQGVMVSRTAKNKKVAYELDTWLLWELMSDHSALWTA